VPEKDLPVLLPDLEDYLPTSTGSSPLARVQAFVDVSCPSCGAKARRETDVSDNFLDSAWYFLRYPSSDHHDVPWDAEITRRWLPVDMYVGGPEHSVLHLLYTRFVCLALHDLGHLPFDEPFGKFRAHGIITKEGAKMSKSKGNVVNPDTYLDDYGADVLRMYLMFIGPFDQGGDFSDRGIDGIARFLSRVALLATRSLSTSLNGVGPEPAVRELHQTIRRVTEDLQNLKFNTAIATLMEYINFLDKQPSVYRSEVATLLLMLAPFAPHFAEEYWERLGEKGSIHRQPWPAFDPDLVKALRTHIAVQVNGKTRDVIEVDVDAAEVDVLRAALASAKVQKYANDREITKVHYVTGRVLSILYS
jgi:leucyl-tRNA synthetase